jgi:hypothetical protein
MSSRRSAILALVSLAAGSLAGCRHIWPTRPETPLLRYEAVREQLVIRSEEPLPQHDRLLEELTAQRGDLLTLLNLPASSQPIYVYLFASPERFRDFMRERYPDLPDRRAFFVEHDGRLEVYAHWGDRVAEDLRHEVAHGYLHSVAPRIPLWLDEGLAEFFEVPRGYQGLNMPHVHQLVERLQEGWQPNLRRLESLSSPAEMDQIDYAESWAWTHYLLHASPAHRDLLRHFLRDVQQQPQSEPLSGRLERAAGPAEQALATYLRELALSRITAAR